jgi:tetratricopeptide (TPR) repeat protein
LTSLRAADCCSADRRCKLRASFEITSWSRVGLLVVALLILSAWPTLTQDAPAQIDGVVHDSAGKAVVGVSIRLQEQGRSSPDEPGVETKTNADGAFEILGVRAGTYTVTLEKSGFRKEVEDSIKLAPAEKKHCDFVLRAQGDSPSLSSTSSPSSAIELDDRPSFTVAGITDSTGSGGHGSETRMRTGEALARDTLNLGSPASETASAASKMKGNETQASESVLRASLAQNPRSFDANHKLGEFYLHAARYREAIPLLQAAYQANPGDYPNAFDLALAFNGNGEFAPAREQVKGILANQKELGKRDEADLRCLLGDLDEKLEDPLGAVQEYERAAGLDASEQNYFAWGTELLLHKAAAPAIEVFGRGVRLHSDSARLLAGLGAALYTSGSADEAAQRLCEASDLDPANPAPYLFLGRMQEATSTSLPCAEQKLARFVQDQPANARANYYYALALWRRDRGSGNSETLRHAEAFFIKASAIDPKFDLPYLQLGNLYFSRGDVRRALAAYQSAVAANPAGSEAHYRLGLTYKRMGDDAKAQREIEEYKRLDKTEADTIERQRRELRQFLFVLKDQPAAAHPASNSLPPSVSK